MQKSVEQMVEDYRQASEELRREIGGDPEKARAFLLSAGITRVALDPPQPVPPADPATPPDAG